MGIPFHSLAASSDGSGSAGGKSDSVGGMTVNVAVLVGSGVAVDVNVGVNVMVGTAVAVGTGTSELHANMVMSRVEPTMSKRALSGWPNDRFVCLCFKQAPLILLEILVLF